MDNDALATALAHGRAFAATLGSIDLIHEASGFNAADLHALVVAAEPVTEADRIEDTLGDLA